jgi:hypothetical protein
MLSPTIDIRSLFACSLGRGGTTEVAVGRGSTNGVAVADRALWLIGSATLMVSGLAGAAVEAEASLNDGRAVVVVTIGGFDA